MISPTYPGVYLEEISSGVHPITGVATSITAMVGRAPRGPLRKPIRVQSVGEYQRVFGNTDAHCPMSYSVRHFFENGGTDAVILRIAHADAVTSKWSRGGFLALEAGTKGEANPGIWADQIAVQVDLDTSNPPGSTNEDLRMFNLIIRLIDVNNPGTVLTTEQFRNVSTDPSSPRYVNGVLAQGSNLVRVDTAVAIAGAPIAQAVDPLERCAGGSDGAPLVFGDYVGTVDDKLGFFALEDTDLFNLLYFPPMAPRVDVPVASVLTPALAYCQERRRAMLIVDAPVAWHEPSDAEIGIGPDVSSPLGGANRGRNAMIYYPWLRMPDPLRENRLDDFPPGGAVAGIIARTDAQRGVWKAPAGIEAGLGGVKDLEYTLTDGENGRLNPLGINCLRTKIPYGHIAWGARTLAGDDRFASEWKYIPVRRTALYIEESLFRGLHWVVFEPNDEPLWGQIRMNTKAFMQNLFKKGAFQGTTPKDAYFVKCDRENNPQSQIDLGIVTVSVGFAPLKPAEFVIIQIQQMAGQIEA